MSGLSEMHMARWQAQTESTWKYLHTAASIQLHFVFKLSAQAKPTNWDICAVIGCLIDRPRFTLHR